MKPFLKSCSSSNNQATHCYGVRHSGTSGRSMLNSEHSQFSWKPNLWPPAPCPADRPASPGSPALPVRGGPRASPPRPSPAASQAPRAPSQGVCLEKLPAGASEETGSPADRGGRPPPGDRGAARCDVPVGTICTGSRAKRLSSPGLGCILQTASDNLF